jgi:hypothetical protein
MDFSPTRCWDCPEPMQGVLPGVVIGFVIALAAVGFLTRRNLVLHALGVVAASSRPAGIFAASAGIWRFGVAWNPAVRTHPTETLLMFNRAGDSVLLLAWWIASAAGLRRALFRWRSRPSAA